ncbi:rodlin [Streptomyces sp. NPDC001795]|uniref:rodlin n=1 Tax=unclassified Streptomyces TaxID=2593676 RepID=UPI0033248B71
MMKKVMAAAMVAASIVGASAATAQQALALGDDGDTTSTSGTSTQEYGNSATYGTMSPQMALVQGSLNKPCIGLPAKASATSLVGLVPVGVQDIPVLSAPPNQQCTENSTQAKGDEPLSHVLDNIPLLSGNGTSTTTPATPATPGTTATGVQGVS